MAGSDTANDPLNIPALARNFLLAALVAAALLKFAEALFNGFWSASDIRDIHDPLHAIKHLFGGLTFLIFCIYAVVTLGRHFAGIYAPEVVSRAEKTGSTFPKRTGVFVFLDFIFTICLLVFHYVLADGVAEAARGGRLGAEAWPLAAFLALSCVLVSHIAVCGVNWLWASRIEFTALRDLFFTWGCLSLIELVASTVALWLFAGASSFTLPLLFLLLLAFVDFILTGAFWRSLGSI